MSDYSTPYYGAAQARRQRRQAWAASANDPTMPEHWADFVGGGGGSESFLQDIDPAASISGAAGIATNYMNMINQGLGLGAVPALQRSATGEPIYNLGGSYNEAFLSDPKGATGGEILSAAGQGASAGFAAGGPVGAGVGAAISTATTIIGGARRKKKQQEERNKTLQKVAAGQQNYNKASEAFDETQIALNEYRERLKNTQMYNLYR